MVVKWLKYDFDTRREFAPSLIRKVRLGLVPEESRNELLDAEITEIPECKQVLEKLTKYEQSSLSSFRRSQRYPQLFTTRSTVKVSYSSRTYFAQCVALFAHAMVHILKFDPLCTPIGSFNCSRVPEWHLSDPKRAHLHLSYIINTVPFFIMLIQ